MRAVVQRVLAARVEVARPAARDGALDVGRAPLDDAANRGVELVGAIDRGLVVFLGAAKGDTLADVSYLVDKILGLRVFENNAGKMDHSVADVTGALLVVSQFTVYGDVRRGRRPSFDRAMPPEQAEELYDAFVALARTKHPKVATGRFRADMRVVVDNDGPVTLILDSRES